MDLVTVKEKQVLISLEKDNINQMRVLADGIPLIGIKPDGEIFGFYVYGKERDRLLDFGFKISGNKVMLNSEFDKDD